MPILRERIYRHIHYRGRTARSGKIQRMLPELWCREKTCTDNRLHRQRECVCFFKQGVEGLKMFIDKRKELLENSYCGNQQNNGVNMLAGNSDSPVFKSARHIKRKGLK